MSKTISAQEALIYVMVTMSAADGNMTDSELGKIGNVVKVLPVFRGFDPENLVRVAEDCGELLGNDEGLDDVLGVVSDTLPKHLKETAYALAVEVAAADASVQQEELRLLELIRHQLNVDRLTAAAIERGARARHMTL